MCRNEVIHGGSLSHPSLLVQHAILNVEEFTKAREPSKIQNISLTVVDQEGKWRAPSRGWVKANWDASLATEKGWMGLGVVARDERGMVLVAHYQTIAGRLASSLVEARAALLAVQTWKELGFSHVHFEGDAKMVVTTINSQEPD